jgi:thiol:disulfide interchange protein DsbD
MKKWLVISVLCLLPFLSMASPPPANEVFQMGVKRIDPNTFVVDWNIKPGYFLYSDRIKITAPENSNVHLGDIRFPKPLSKIDHQGHQYTIYRNQLTLPVSVLGEQAGEALVDLHYQGCSDDGFCYPPETKQILLSIGENLSLVSASLYEATTTLPKAKEVTPESNEVDRLFNNGHWPVILLSFFGFGLLLAFTPCVLPMVPVLSGIIVGHGADLSTRKAFLLSLSYVVSMAVTYAVVGAVVALLGSNLQVVMQTPLAISLFSLLFVLLALSMFGYFELKLPVSWQAKLAGFNRSQANGHYWGAAIMGCLSTLILSPCVTAPLIGALGYIARSGNVLLGSISLFFLGMGMGTPLLLIGMSAGRWLPKAGLWMNAVKYFFGVMLLGVAIYLLGRVLPGSLVMGLWSALLIFSGIFAGALIPGRTHHEKFSQAAGIMMLVYGLLLLVGASMGGSNPLQPLANWSATASTVKTLAKETVTNEDELKQAIFAAHGKPIILDFYADWCASCLVMEATTFKDPELLAALDNFVTIKVDITANDADSKALLESNHVVAPPSFLFLDKEGKLLDQYTLVGEVSAKEFLQQLQRVETVL